VRAAAALCALNKGAIFCTFVYLEKPASNEQTIPMSSPDMLLDVLRAELRAAGITYKTLAERIAMSESSIKRMFGQKDMTLSRLAQIRNTSSMAMRGPRPTP
jgi:AraC-like DNA-binding protein